MFLVLLLCRWDEAAADYKAVLAVAPEDPSAWNNLGNTNMGEVDAGCSWQRIPAVQVTYSLKYPAVF
jgi:hypothetical protein